MLFFTLKKFSLVDSESMIVADVGEYTEKLTI